MSIALHRIFRKKLLLWICLLFLFGALKIFSAFLANEYYPQYNHIDIWLKDCRTVSEEELDGYVSQLAQQVNSDEQHLKVVGRDFYAFLESYENRVFVQNLINFAKNGEGALGTGIPDNFGNLQDFYRELDAPAVINEQPLDQYFFLQSISIVPIIVLLLCAIIWGEHFEQGIYRVTESTPNGETYYKTYNVVLLSLGLCFLIFNELFDLWQSGLLENEYIWKSPVQSYGCFRYVQLHCSIGVIWAISFTSKLIGVFTLCLVGLLIAKWKKSVKDSVVWIMLLLIAFLFLGKALENTGIYSVMQLGIINWQDLIRNATILLPLPLNTLVLGLIITFLITAMLYCYVTFKRSQKHCVKVSTASTTK